MIRGESRSRHWEVRRGQAKLEIEGRVDIDPKISGSKRVRTEKHEGMMILMINERNDSNAKKENI